MCATYGLTPTGERILLPGGLEPYSEKVADRVVSDWMSARGGTAKITGKNALNLNPIIRAGESRRDVLLAWWWLWLDSSGPVKFSAFNSRDDRLLRSWKRPFQHRAILPASWYIEKKGRFHLPGDEVFGIAAVTSTVTRDDGTELVTYSMVTRDAPAGSEAADHWGRMPLVLPLDMHNEWLDPDRPGDESLVAEAQHGSEEISREFTTA